VTAVQLQFNNTHIPWAHFTVHLDFPTNSYWLTL